MPISRRLQLIGAKAIRLVFLLLSLSVSFVISSEDEVTRTVPLLHSSNDSFTGVLRFINHSKDTQNVSIVGFDDEGTKYGPATFIIGSQENRLVYSDDLEDGSSDIVDGLGRGSGSWRLEISTSGDVEVTSYSEAQDGLLESLQATVRGENGCWRIPTFYSADNLTTSKLRLSNPGIETANVKISGRDDDGSLTATNIELSIKAGVSKSFTAVQLEDGSSNFTGSLGNGNGNWQLAVESDRLITVMNLIESDRYMSNVSTRPSYAIGHCWLGKTLANADRSISSLIEDATIGNRPIPTGIDPAPLTPAVYVAIVDETGVRAIGAEGVKKWGGDTKASIHDRLYLGSITKPMTATMIATYVYEDGSIFSNGWDTTIKDVFGDLIDDIHEDYHEVKLKEILTHQSGIQEFLPDEWEDDPELTLIERRQAAMLATLASEARADRGSVSYSHVGYLVAAAMVERLTGRTWEAEMQERLFKPLGMASAGFGPPVRTDRENEPWGHTLSVENEWLPTDDDWHVVLQPTAGVHSSMEDLAKFLQLWMDDKEPMLLSREQIHSLTRLAANENGEILRFLFTGGSPSAGWWLYSNVFGYGEALNTPGSNGNWYSLVWVMRDISRAYLVVVNSALPTDLYGDFGTINNVLTPIITRLASSAARSAPPQLPDSELSD